MTSPPTAPFTARAAPGAAGADRWRAVLREPLSSGPSPRLHASGTLVDAAALRAGAGAWAAWLRARGIAPGDRIVCALPAGAAFVMVLLAALHEGLTLVPVAPADDVAAARRALDARLALREAADGEYEVAPQADGHPPADAPALADAAAPPTPDVRLLLHTSGTSHARRWIALGDANLWAVLDTHAPLLALDGATVLSALPWHHAFGLVLELLPALLAGATLVRAASGGRDLDALLALAAAHPITHLSAVPHTVRRLVARPDGMALLARLRGGVIGGAPVDGALAETLRRTRLRVGYGQTEAGPGITLGEPGEWRAGILGRPVGCDVRIEDDGVLAFRGANACVGEWRGGTLARLPAARWVRTGDLARAEPDGGYTFEGRLADAFKLANGRFVAAAAIEEAVRTRFPHVAEALLSSPDGETLVLALSGDAPLPDAAAVAPLLGALAGRPLRVRVVSPDGWVRTAKGELDRRADAAGVIGRG